MTKPVRVTLALLCALALLALPLLLSSGAMLYSAKEAYMEHEEDMGDLFGAIFGGTAYADETDEIAEPVALPIDFTGGMTPNPDAYTENGYADGSITVEVRDEFPHDDGYFFKVVTITVADASQLRTVTASGRAGGNKDAMPTAMAKKVNAIVAINASNYVDDSQKKTFEYRMGGKIRADKNNTKDMLIIDENGDFHILSKGTTENIKALAASFKQDGHTIVNAFTFGPALVIDGQAQKVDKNYSYAPNARNPRMAIGQLDALTYVVVLAEADSARTGKHGATHQELADFMAGIGCKQAYNFDGGNSSILIVGDKDYHGQRGSKERAQSDIIYFATTVDPSQWGK